MMAISEQALSEFQMSLLYSDEGAPEVRRGKAKGAHAPITFLCPSIKNA